MNTQRQDPNPIQGIRVPGGTRSLVRRYRHLLPSTNYGDFDPALIWIFATRMSIVHSLYLSVRFGGWFIVARRTRIKIGRRSKVTIARGSFFFVGFVHYGPTPAAIHIGRGRHLVHRGNRPDQKGGSGVRPRRRAISRCTRVRVWPTTRP